MKIMVNKIYHFNDRTMKYKTLAQSSRQHQYLGLPGNYMRRLPQEIAFPNLKVGRADEFYLTDNGLIIDLEEESDIITFKTLDKFSKYAIFASYRYNGKIYLAVLCHKDPKKDFEYFEYAPSLFIKVHYIYFSHEELWMKYENIINKVRQNIRLTEMEALDMAFVAKFISKKHAPMIVDSLANIFNDAIIDDELLKIDVGVILGGMIQKHFTGAKQNRLMEIINMKQIEDDFTKFLYEEFGDELYKKDEEIESQAQEIKSKEDEINKLNKNNNEYKTKLKQLSQIKDLNTPEARNIINSLILLS